MAYRTREPKLAISKPGIMVLLLSLLMLTNAYGQATSGWEKENNWFISGNTGMAILAGEMTKGFSFLPNEFGHRPGFTFNLDFGRTFGNRWESLIRVNAYTLFGKSNLPEFSAIGYQSNLKGQLFQIPVEYISSNSSVSILLRYMFKNQGHGQGSTVRFNPFAEAGIGIHSFLSELRYQIAPADSLSPLILKKKDGDTPIGVAAITTGLGVRTGASDTWNLVFLWNTEFINYDAIDAVHNYSNGTRNHSWTLVMKLTAGLIIPFGGNSPADIFLPFRRW